jgi:hypothetical protein
MKNFFIYHPNYSASREEIIVKLRAQKDDIMANFDFRKVHRMMELVNWEWYKVGGARVPSLEEVVAAGNEYLEAAIVAFGKEYNEGDYWETGSGGFMARYHAHCGLTLEFIFESWDGWISS